jgi:hypothetical protein
LEYARDLLRNTQPVVRSEEEQTWDASGLIAQNDFKIQLFWDSKVPGSAAPECLMAGALQSLENKGMTLDPACDQLLAEGLAALAAQDFEALHRIDMTLRAHMRAARPDPAHPARQSLRFDNWDDFRASVAFPADTEVDDRGLADRIRAGWLGQLVGAAAGTALEGYTAENLAEAFGGLIDTCVRRIPTMTTSPSKLHSWRPSPHAAPT